MEGLVGSHLANLILLQVGYGVNKGIVPLAFESMFKKITGNTDPNVTFEVTFSMLEVYMERVADLLADKGKGENMKVREDTKGGRFYVQGLSQIPVGSYKEIEDRMNSGIANRMHFSPGVRRAFTEQGFHVLNPGGGGLGTVAATQMNATSSRAHTVVTVIFSQNIVDAESGAKSRRTSEISLIDLAGSERASGTGASGNTLKEGAMINKSLSALGNVISALATGKKAPFRDSVLTKLLQNSLGGNAKTVMIAALSPADINYDETLSTLRYADRAKQIKNQATVQESATDKLIRELKEENDRMKAALATGGITLSAEQTAGKSEAEIEMMKNEIEADIRAELEANMAKSSSMDEGVYEAKLAAMRAEFEAANGASKFGASAAAASGKNHLSNLNSDPSMSGVVAYVIDEGINVVGHKDDDPTNDPENLKIALAGLSIDNEHAVLRSEKGVVALTQSDPLRAARTVVNGKPLAGTVTLKHNDRVLFGANHLFLFKAANGGSEKSPDYEEAQAEIMAAKGFSTDSHDSLHLNVDTREEVMELLPMVSEAIAIAEKLNKHRQYEIAVLSGPVAGLQIGECKTMVKVRNIDSNNRVMLTPGEFQDRRFRMQELMLDPESPGDDPFALPDGDVIIGAATCFLQALCYCIEFEDNISIVDYKGRSEGKLTVSIWPCDKNGTNLTSEACVDDPKELLGKPISFKIIIEEGDLKKSKFNRGLFVEYSNKFLNDGEVIRTKRIEGSNRCSWNHTATFTIPVVTKDVINWFSTGNVGFFVHGYQSDTVSDGDFSSAELAGMHAANKGGQLCISPVHQASASSINAAAKVKEGQLIKKIDSVMGVLQDLKQGKRSESDSLRAIEALLQGGSLPPPTTAKVPVSANAKSGACTVM